MHRSDVARGLGFFVGGVGPLLVASLLVPLREQPIADDVAFLLMAGVVSAAGVLAGYGGGGGAGVTATLAYDFFFSRPYLKLDVDSADDGRRMILLLAAGLGAAALANRPRAARVTAARTVPTRPNESRHIQRVAGLIAQGADPRDVISAVQAELTVLLLLRSCRFETGESPGPRPRLERNGLVSTGHLLHEHGGVQLPAGGLELPVRAGSFVFGRFVLDPTPGTSVPLERRVVAVILSDHLGVAIARNPPFAVHGRKARFGADRRATRRRHGRPVPPVPF